ncbi:MAG: HlyD family efflux transporter periplasmic adaptor subunit [Planctomycetes bacterium]|nr:HlyD family efflux transporter periplasmic adaptor subunit [Planctomycetota bacterium]
MKKWPFILVGVLVVAGGLYYFLVGIGVQPLTEKRLTFTDVRRVTIRDIVSATGLVEPQEIVVVTSKNPGAVVRLSGRIGDSVMEGAELAQLDDERIALKVEEAKDGIKMADAALRQAQALVLQAKASKDAAERNVKTQKEIANAGGIRAERELAEAQLQAALAGIKAAEAGVHVAQAKQAAALTASREAELIHRMTRIRVPGLTDPLSKKVRREFLILDRKVHEGQMVGPQSGPLFLLAGRLDVVEVHAQVAEGDVNKIRAGLTVLFKITNYRDEDSDYEGTIKKIRPQASVLKDAKGAVYYDAVVEVKNRKAPETQDWQLRPGMTVSVDIVRYEHKNAWRLPDKALNFDLEQPYQSAAAKARLVEWAKRPDAKDWRALWTWDESTRAAKPIFARIVPRAGEVALKDAEGNEILEWEPGFQPTDPVRVIIGAPRAHPPGFFDQPANVKL